MRAYLALYLLLAIPAWAAPTSAVDDTGVAVHLASPARRILTLSPHATELVFAAGAGDRLVGTVAFSDYPPEAIRLPRIGDSARLDREALLMREPDLVVAWPTGNRAADIAWIESRGIPVFRSNPQRLAHIPHNIRQLGRLMATEETAERNAQGFESRLLDLRQEHAKATEVPVFYQLWPSPLITAGNDALLNELLHLCGAKNIFENLDVPAPQVDAEAVLAAGPVGIVAATIANQNDPFVLWRQWPQMTAVREGHLLTIPADLLQRPSPRILDGAALVCEGVAAWR